MRDAYRVFMGGVVVNRVLRPLGLFIFTVALSGCMFSPPAGTVKNSQDSTSTPAADYLKDTLLVRPAQGVTPETVADCIGGSVALVREGLVRIHLPAGADLAASLVKLQETQALIVYAEPIYIYHADMSGAPRLISGAKIDYTVEQWGLAAIHADTIRGEPNGIQGPLVAVIDTGADPSAPDLAGKITSGRNTVTGQKTGTYKDDHGQGTFIAGVIGAGDAKGGLQGVAVAARILAVKAANAEGNGASDDIACGVRWSVDHGARIVVIGLDGTGFSRAMQEAVDYAVERGVAVFAGMGNTSRPGAIYYPAAYQGVIAVAAVKRDGAKAAFSPEGKYVSLAGPGVDIVSALWSKNGPSLAYWNGCAPAAAHAGGAAALLLTAHPEIGATRIRTLLEATAAQAGKWDKSLGFGLIDVQASLDQFAAFADVYGALAVTVFDLTHPVPGIKVVLTDQTGATAAVNYTNAEGAAFFGLIRAGTYTVTVADADTGLAGTGEIRITAGSEAAKMAINLH